MTRIAIIGSGFSGIGAAVRLLADGERDVVLFERSDDVGGVWRDNSYPGAACDVPSHLYSFSWAPDGRWSRRFAVQSEIHDYLRRLASEHGVLPHVRFRTEVLTADWDGACWQLALSDGTTHEADVVIAACGQLSRPSRPDVPGLDDFAGTTFHSAEWDHDHDLTGRRVAVLGTGASAIQFVPEITPKVAALTVFQRSAPYVIAKPDRAYGPATKALLQRVPAVLAADRLRTYLWCEARSLGFNTEPRIMRLLEAKFRRYLRSQVADPALRARLTPTDPIGCKRILQSNDWYPALTQPHVGVVTDAVTAVVPEGVVTADGRVHEVDTLILGTGFAATELLLPMQVTGRDGVQLSQVWRDGAEAHLGTTVNGFPNLFLLYGPNTNLGHNSIILMLESQIAYVADAVRLLREGAAALEVRREVQQRFNDRLQTRLAGTVFAGGCRSWYLTADGRNTQNWPGTTADYRRRTRRVRVEDFHVTHRVTPERESIGA